ncbi:MAG: ImmA/IrrE family metallo-endopeptidase [Candidatus Marinimicrobia bacterium]|nr:ImmA/IrrE family metallo-endopeptidase [Candidatus Neomarinimicrobiota bacterium]
MPKVNPEILQWARESAYLTTEDAAKKLEIHDLDDLTASDRLTLLESGEVEPSRPLLLKMANKYRRPLLVFYMSHPPRKGDRGQDFRTLPEEHPKADDFLLDTLLRKVMARQDLIRSTMVGEDEAFPLPFVGLHQSSDTIQTLATSICQILDLNINEYHTALSTKDAFNLLRDKTEKAGVFVLLIGNLGSYHTNLDVETFRGYSLADQFAPFIIINTNDSRAAWSFTLLHEMAHILLGQTGVSNARSDIAIEKLCNQTAGTILLPSNELDQIRIPATTSFITVFETISDFAYRRNISGSMVSYKLFLKETINHEMWTRLTKEFRSRWQQNRAKQSERLRKGEPLPLYYPISRRSVGPSLIKIVSRYLHSGILTTTKAGMILGVKPKNVQNLIEFG